MCQLYSVDCSRCSTTFTHAARDAVLAKVCWLGHMLTEHPHDASVSDLDPEMAQLAEAAVSTRAALWWHEVDKALLVTPETVQLVPPNVTLMALGQPLDVDL